MPRFQAISPPWGGSGNESTLYRIVRSGPFRVLALRTEDPSGSEWVIHVSDPTRPAYCLFASLNPMTVNFSSPLTTSRRPVPINVDLDPNPTSFTLTGPAVNLPVLFE